MKRLFLSVVLAVLTACATMNPNAQVKAAYDLVTAYTDATAVALMRGRITPDQAAKASANAKKARESIDVTAAALKGCAPPCDPQKLAQGLQPMLIELEKELRERQKQ